MREGGVADHTTGHGGAASVAEPATEPPGSTGTVVPGASEAERDDSTDFLRAQAAAAVAGVSAGVVAVETSAPTATAVGETLALRLAVGAAEGDLRPTLRAHAGEAAARVNRRAATLVRLAAYAVLLWVSVRSVTAMTSIDLTAGGAGPLQLDGALRDSLNVDPEQQREVEQLLRELDL